MDENIHKEAQELLKVVGFCKKYDICYVFSHSFMKFFGALADAETAEAEQIKEFKETHYPTTAKWEDYESFDARDLEEEQAYAALCLLRSCQSAI